MISKQPHLLEGAQDSLAQAVPLAFAQMSWDELINLRVEQTNPCIQSAKASDQINFFRIDSRFRLLFSVFSSVLSKKLDQWIRPVSIKPAMQYYTITVLNYVSTIYGNRVTCKVKYPGATEIPFDNPNDRSCQFSNTSFGRSFL